MILQVHDELVFDIPESEETIFSSLVRDTMEGVLAEHTCGSTDRTPPIMVDIGIGKNWTETK